MNNALLLLAGVIIIAIAFLFGGLVLTIVLILRKNKNQSRLHGSDEFLVENIDESPTTM